MKTPPDPLEKAFEERKKRALRWAMQAAARELLPASNVRVCCRYVVPHKLPKIMYSPSVDKYHYKNLMVCGLVWIDPICAAKVSERRRLEMKQAIDTHPEYQIALVTFTVRHKRGDDLGPLLDDLLKSFSRLKSGRTWIEFERRHGVVGSWRSLEVTHGKNGWHPHLHVLLFCKQGAEWRALEGELKLRWREVLAANKRTANYQRGVDVRTANRDVADYIEKWGREPLDLKRPFGWTIEHEMTKSVVKVARTEKGRTPMQLLADYVMGDEAAGALFVEYAAAFKGKRQLSPSRGLRALLGLGQEKSDKDLAEEDREDSIVFMHLTLRQWRVILANDMRGEVLEVCHSRDPNKVKEFLKNIGADDPVSEARRARMDKTRRVLARARALKSETASKNARHSPPQPQQGPLLPKSDR